MKTVSIQIEDTVWESIQQAAHVQGKAVADLVSSAVSGVITESAEIPSPGDRREALGRLWERIDACNAEVGERPNRARTYDHRRFHRH